MKVIFSVLAFMAPCIAVAETHVARIVKIENQATVYVPSDEKSEAKEKLVKYMEKIYRILPAEKGMKLDNGYVVTTGPQGKIKVVYNNGDHFFVSPNTQYYVEWKKQHLKEKEPSTMTILRGAVRGLVEKGGPRSGMEISTKNTVLGIRGTDFHVSHYNSGLTQVSVLRGTVELKETDKNQKVVIVDAGQMFLKKEDNSALTPLTKSDLRAIAAESAIKPQEVKEPELAALEKKASETTLNDIKEYQPELYEKLKKSPNLDSDSLALNTARNLEETAPEKKKKPGWAELYDEQDPYERYKPKSP